MNAYEITATVMRALRLFALVLAMGIIATWWSSLSRLLRGQPAAVATIVAGDVGEERERNRAKFVTFAGAIFLFQLGFLAPLPDLTVLRLWMAGLVIVISTLLWAIYDHGAHDPRFRPRRTAISHLGLFFVCALFALVTR